jgi:hypothetical protein
MEKVKYIKDIQLIREKDAPQLMAIKAKGIAELKHLLSPVLVSASDPKKPSSDGIYEMDFVLGDTGDTPIDVEMEVDVVFRFKNLPKWVKGIKVNARDNSDIELIL